MSSEETDASALSANLYASERLIHTLFKNFNMAFFQKDYESAVKLYGELGSQIQELSTIKISRKARSLLTRVRSVSNCDPVILRDIGETVDIFQAIENEAEQYVRRARNFAKENHLVAENVKERKQFFDPMALLENFNKTSKRLDDSFKAVINKHSKVAQDISDISGKVSIKRNEAKKLSDQAEISRVCSIPVLSLITAPVFRATQYADAVSNPLGKTLAGCAGAVGGLLEGFFSTAMLGIPMAMAISNEKKFTELRKEYESMKEFLERFDKLVSRHKGLLSDLCSHVSMLPDKYTDVLEGLGRGESLEDYQIALFQIACNNIIDSCDVYIAQS